MTAAEREVYASAAGGRRVLARLRHPRPVHVTADWLWAFRHTDAAIAAHINNAAYWQPLEHELIVTPREPVSIEVEIEFRTPTQPDVKRVLAGGVRRRIVGCDDRDQVYASIVLMKALTTSGSNWEPAPSSSS